MVKRLPATERLLKQYYKRDACRLCSIHSKILCDKGFLPINPVKAEGYQAITNKDELLMLESFVVKQFAYRTFVATEFQVMFNKLKTSTMLLAKLQIDSIECGTFRELDDAVHIKGKWKFILSLLANIKKEKMAFFKDDKKTSISRKKNMIDLRDFGFFRLLDSRNMKQIENVKKEVLNSL